MDNVVRGLSTYAGRDAMIRVTCYFFLFLFGILKDIDHTADLDNLRQRSGDGFRIFIVENMLYFVALESLPHLAHASLAISRHFATARLIARFFDNIPAIFNLYTHMTRRNGVKKQNKSKNNVQQEENVSKILFFK
jgi:hypothetical protein